MNRSIDARALPCPKPVILTKQAVDEGGFTTLQIIVDNEPAKENVKRFLTRSGYTNLSVVEEHGEFTITTDSKRKQASDTASLAPKTLFFSSEYLGSGDAALGTLLMRGFIYSLTELDQKPSRLVFMNSSVSLATEGARTLSDLQKLEHSGVEILVCGTCLDYYHLTDSLAVGIISNMYTITEALLEGNGAVTIS